MGRKVSDEWTVPLCAIHHRALHAVGDEESQVLNCGYGHGFSVKEVLDKVPEVAGSKLDIRSGNRRPGDPTKLEADTSRIQEMGWRPAHDDLSESVNSALRWQRKITALT